MDDNITWLQLGASFTVNCMGSIVSRISLEDDSIESDRSFNCNTDVLNLCKSQLFGIPFFKPGPQIVFHLVPLFKLPTCIHTLENDYYNDLVEKFSIFLFISDRHPI